MEPFIPYLRWLSILQSLFHVPELITGGIGFSLIGYAFTDQFNTTKMKLQLKQLQEYNYDYKIFEKAPLHSRSDDTKTQQIVRDILHDIENGDEKALEYASKFDKYEGEIILSESAIEAAAELFQRR